MAAVRPKGAEGLQHFQYPTTCCTAAHRGFVPAADSRTAAKRHTGRNLLFGHLVGEREQLIWNSQAQRLSSLEVDDQFELGWQLHEQVTRFCAFQKRCDVEPGRRR
jgi:hypothetical protein